MTAREKFLRIMNYQPVDSIPVLTLEPYEEGAIARWQAEGMPGSGWPTACLGMDELCMVPVSFYPTPPFEKEIVAEDAESYTEVFPLGGLVKRMRKNPSTFYGHIDHPVKCRADWDVYKQRFQAGPGRLHVGRHGEKTYAAIAASDMPVALTFFPFFTRLGFYALGMERFLTAFYEEPDLIHDMFAYWCDFALETIRPIFDHITVDVAIFGEDIAGKNGPLVSPRIYQEFWVRHQAPLVHFLQEKGVPYLCQWTAGQVDPLLPVMLEQGFNCTWPLEVSAGMDATAVRKKYGRNLRLAGNIPVRAVIDGPAAIDQEIARLLPLIRAGGFFPTLDDMAPLEAPWDHFRYLVSALRQIKL